MNQPQAETPGSGLLNALDGVATPHGLVSFMTTNSMSVLDAALLRPGRADRIEEIGYVDDEQLRRLVTTLAGVDLDLPAVDGDLAPAAVIEQIRRHLDDPDALTEALTAIIEGDDHP